MPQFDTFIFSSSLIYFISSYFILLSAIFTRFIPRLGAIIKLRDRIASKSNPLQDSKPPLNDYLTIFARNLTNTDKI